MLGSILGDIIGSVYEFHPTKRMDFPWHRRGMFYTDDTAMTIATLEVLTDPSISYVQAYRNHALYDLERGYGSRFFSWVLSDSDEPYNSYGNGSAMRVSPVGWAFESLDEVLKEAQRSAEVTHNHPEGIKGGQAIACAIFMARKGLSKETIKTEIMERFGYDLNRKLDDLRPSYHFSEICQTSVPEAILAFLESDSLESAIRLAVSLGGDADTQACIAGGIAEAYYGPISKADYDFVLERLHPHQIALIHRFYQSQNLPLWRD